MRIHVEKARGDIGEAMFLYWMAVFVWIVSRPFGDKQSYDYVVDTRKKLLRVQVKTAYTKTAANSYHVCVGRSEGMKYKPFQKREIDFLVVYLMPEDAWLVLPFSALKGRVAVSIAKKGHPARKRWEKYVGAWELMLGRKPKGLKLRS